MNTEIIVVIISTSGAILGPIVTILVTRTLSRHDRQEAAESKSVSPMEDSDVAVPRAPAQPESVREAVVPEQSSGDMTGFTSLDSGERPVSNLVPSALGRWQVMNRESWWRPFLAPCLASLAGIGHAATQTGYIAADPRESSLGLFIAMGGGAVLYISVMAISWYRAWSYGIRTSRRGSMVAMHLELIGIWSAYIALEVLFSPLFFEMVADGNHTSSIDISRILSWAIPAWITVAIVASFLVLRARRTVEEIIRLVGATALKRTVGGEER
ncbi:hypothetical protein KJ564_10420 [bacterium]|nr:hypothetical protein [bacterium]